MKEISYIKQRNLYSSFLTAQHGPLTNRLIFVSYSNEGRLTVIMFVINWLL